jgi:hydrogenase maturation protease
MVLGCGNPSRGDDALGPALMERLEAWMHRHPERPVEAVEDFQFQVEHALDVQGRALVLFVDAAASGPDPYALRQLAPAVDASFSTHALSPAGVLLAFTSLACGAPPPAFSLGVRGHGFELGEDLSAQACSNLEAAWVLLQRLLENPSREYWEALCAP